MDLMEIIRTRHAALVQQRTDAIAEYERLEAALAALRRQIDAMTGGVGELAALLPPPENA